MPLLALLFACIDFRIDPFDSDPEPVRAVVEDRFVQAPTPPVDLLFVVDNSGSMLQEQQTFATAMAPLVDALSASGVSWQIGVVTTDMAREDAGELLGSPWVLTAAVPNVGAVVADRLIVGSNAEGPAEGFAAALQALDYATSEGPNVGFRRENAALYIVFISDDDDASAAWVGADAATEFIDALAISPGQLTISAVVGDSPDGCTSLQGSASPGDRYHAAVEATGGVTESICSLAYSALADALFALTATGNAEFHLTSDPVDDDVRVDFDGVRQTSGWTLFRDENGARLVFAEPPPLGVEIVVSYAIEIDP